MTVRPDYSLSRARYTHFLFTVVGTETHEASNRGEDITVLTALSRVGVDPWQEAARLARLPRGDAARSLADTFTNLPDTHWAEGDAQGTAHDRDAAADCATRTGDARRLDLPDLALLGRGGTGAGNGRAQRLCRESRATDLIVSDWTEF